MKNYKGLFIKDPNFWRVPRKLKKQIPKDTHYCYTPLSDWKVFKDGKSGYQIKPCIFLDYIKLKDMKPLPEYMDCQFIEEYGEETQGWCKLIKYEIEDQCKSCGLKY